MSINCPCICLQQHRTPLYAYGVNNNIILPHLTEVSSHLVQICNSEKSQFVINNCFKQAKQNQYITKQIVALMTVDFYLHAIYI